MSDFEDREIFNHSADENVFEFSVKLDKIIVAKNTHKKIIRCPRIKKMILDHCNSIGSLNFSDFYKNNKINLEGIELIMLDNSFLDFTCIDSGSINYIYISKFEYSFSEGINIVFKENTTVDKIIFSKVSMNFFLKSVKNLLNVCKNFYLEGKYFNYIEKNEENYSIFEQLSLLECNIYSLNRIKNTKEKILKEQLDFEIKKAKVAPDDIHKVYLKILNSFPELSQEELFCFEDSVTTDLKSYFFRKKKFWIEKILRDKIESYTDSIM